MIIQASNNKPSGSLQKSCDAGIPISGRTGTGATDTYEILTVLPNGAIPNSAPNSALTTPYANNPVVIGGSGILAPNIFIHYEANFVTVTSAGVYLIDYAIQFIDVTIGSVDSLDLVLSDNVSNLSGYAGGLVPCADPFNPSTVDYLGGNGYLITNVPLSQIGSTGAVTTQRQGGQVTKFLGVGGYDLIIVAHTNFTINSPETFLQLNQFSRIA